MSEADQYLAAEARARVEIDKMLEACGWLVQNADSVNLMAAQGVDQQALHVEGEPPS